MSLSEDVRASLRAFPDFPSQGILFQDVAPVLGDPKLLRRVVDAMAAPWRGKVDDVASASRNGPEGPRDLSTSRGLSSTRVVDAVAGVESRGFILGAPVALALDARFVPVRKKGKLPGRVLHEEYDLEYARATVEIQEDAVRAGERVLLVDDVLATAGTANAALRLVEKAGARVVGFAFLLEIAALNGRATLPRESTVIARV